MQQIATYDSDPTPELSGEQITAIAVLAGGGNVSEAAVAAGVSRSTIYRWMDRDPEFMAELHRFKAERQTALRAQVGELADKAIEAIRGILEGEAANPAVKLKAALAILEGAGALEPDKPGSTNADDIKGDWKTRNLLRSLAG